MYVCNWPPLRFMCRNHEVVDFQPHIGTTQYLGSIASYNFYSIPPAQPVSTVTAYFYSSPSSYHPPISNHLSSYHLSMMNLLPAFSPSTKLLRPGHCPHHPPISLRRSNMRPTPRACVSRHFLYPFIPPLLHLAFA